MEVNILSKKQIEKIIDEKIERFLDKIDKEKQQLYKRIELIEDTLKCKN